MTVSSLVSFVSCEDLPAEIPDYRDWITEDETSEPVPEENLYEFEKAHKDITAPSDLVLIYGGSAHRQPVDFLESSAIDYVSYKDRSGESHWLFDGMLFLEFMDAGGPYDNKTFVTGYQYNGEYLPSADKSYWERLADYYFKEGVNLDAVESAIRKVSSAVGNPPSKRKIIIGIPEPITWEYSNTSSGTTAYWGELDGRTLDFSVNEDRVAACRWYIDRIRANFASKEYEYIDLVGFYWVAERASYTDKVMPEIAEYLNSMNYSFNWIPYYNADGSTAWKSYGFNYAYLQPNYFFNDVDYSRLTNACNTAELYGMGMEMEFDGNALASNGRGYKLRDYMKAFRENGVWENSILAYYQGSYALKWLKDSDIREDVDLYNDFCEFVITRPVRERD